MIAIGDTGFGRNQAVPEGMRRFLEEVRTR